MKRIWIALAALALSVGMSSKEAEASYGWCASQGGWCDVQAAGTVRYGVNGAYYYRTFDYSQEVHCDDDAFGMPAYGSKECYVEYYSNSPESNPVGAWNSSSSSEETVISGTTDTQIDSSIVPNAFSTSRGWACQIPYISGVYPGNLCVANSGPSFKQQLLSCVQRGYTRCRPTYY